jgi:uncharacterized protein (TIGR03083 family)
MRPVREAFLVAGHSAAALLRLPQVEQCWARPSALAEFSVSGLCGHLANQVINASAVLDREPLDEAPIPLLQHYFKGSWMGAPIGDDVNVQIRATGEQVAGDGPADLAARLEQHLESLRRKLPREPEDRIVPVGGRWNLRLDDYLVTRMMELAVHSDDVAVSVGVDPPPLPPTVLDPVLDLLTRLSLHKHGQAAMLRALTRKERAPADITAF